MPRLTLSAAAQLRALMYVTSLTSEIMDAMVGVENAIESALERQTTFHPVKFHLRKKSAAYDRCEGEVLPHLPTMAQCPGDGA